LLAPTPTPADAAPDLAAPSGDESTFATVRLRLRQTKGSGSRDACLAMVHKLAENAQRHWRKLDGHQLIPEVLAGRCFVDGINETIHRDAA
jgi:hypothetical protein